MCLPQDTPAAREFARGHERMTRAAGNYSIRGEESEDRGQKTEGRRRRTEDRKGSSRMG
jgi:hypothetical protein